MRKSLLLALIATALGVSGCRMCSDCFDDAGPVHEPGYANNGTYGRAGSVSGGHPMVIGEEVILEDSTMMEAPPLRMLLED